MRRALFIVVTVSVCEGRVFQLRRHRRVKSQPEGWRIRVRERAYAKSREGSLTNSLTDETGGTTNYRIDYDRVRRQYLVGIQLPNSPKPTALTRRQPSKGYGAPIRSGRPTPTTAA
jgi:hypothetical protein